ncbi:MAG TPA: hypothetical protein ENJ95_01825 [Bacteroidetes bacterium]|nr:hypothetical protein [Bacteroidota bacterium]
MKNSFKTSFEFTKNLLTTGAFKETSRRVEIEICSKLPTGPNRVIVEFGMGHANISKEILRTISPSSKLYAFEVKEEFCDHVAALINDERLIIINDGAENLHKHVGTPVHGFVSTIPFTFFSKEMSNAILNQAYEALAPGHYFSQALYSKAHMKKFKNTFDEVTLKRFLNIPLECVHHCKKNA